MKKNYEQKSEEVLKLQRMLDHGTSYNLFDIESEQIVLGAVLVENQEIYRIPNLKAEHFFEPVHQRIFKAVISAIHSGKAASPVTLKPQFNSDPALENIGKAGYLAKLAGRVHGLLDVRTYATVVFDMFKRRELSVLIEESLTQLRNPTLEKSCGELQSEMTGKILNSGNECENLKIHRFDKVTLDIMYGWEKPLERFATGIRQLDRCYAGGLYLGKSYCIVANK